MNVTLSASRVAHRYASLRSAGLYDVDLLRKFVQAVLQDEPPASSWRTFNEAEMSAVTTSYDSTAGWVSWRTVAHRDDPPDDYELPEEEAEAEVPTGATGTFVFTLGKKLLNLLVQVPEAQRADFLADALRILFMKHATYFFEPSLLPAIGTFLNEKGTEGWVNWEYGSKNGDVWSVKKVKSMKVQKLEPIGRPKVSSGIASWKFRFTLAFDVDFNYTSEREFEAGFDEPDDDYGPYGYSPD